MNEKKAKVLRRMAEMIGPNTDQILYLRDEKTRVITVHPNCRRGIYRKLKKEINNIARREAHEEE